MIGGKYTLRGGRREGRLGTWQTLSDQDGQVHGGLSLNTSALDEAAARRLSDAIRATNNLPGVLSLIDQAVENDIVWLISVTPASPTISQALAAGSPIPAAVSLQIAVDCGQTLTALHAAGAAHGDVSGDNVILGATGTISLAECGYAHALAGTRPGPGHDVNGWIAILRQLAKPRPDDTVKQLLLSAAMEAEGTGGAPGLAAGLAVLTEGASGVPGYADRGSLALVSATVSSATAVAPGLAAAPLARPASSAAPASSGIPASSATDATMRIDPGQVLSDDHAVTLPPQELATRLGNLARENVERSTPRADADGIVRFGRGVAAPQAPVPPQGAMPGWNTGTAPMPAPRRRKKSWIAAAITFVLTVALFVAIAYVLYERNKTPLAITSAPTVAPVSPLGTRCDFDVDIVGKISTNGERGTIKYHWEEVVGEKVEKTDVFEKVVNQGASAVEVHLIWKFSGKGSVKAKAVLKVEAPQITEGFSEFTYTCK